MARLVFVLGRQLYVCVLCGMCLQLGVSPARCVVLIEQYALCSHHVLFSALLCALQAGHSSALRCVCRRLECTGAPGHGG